MLQANKQLYGNFRGTVMVGLYTVQRHASSALVLLLTPLFLEIFHQVVKVGYCIAMFRVLFIDMGHLVAALMSRDRR
jgi:hypothetical protein